MALNTTEYGKAFEYACLKALKEQISSVSPFPVLVNTSSAYYTAKESFSLAVAYGVDGKLLSAARAAARSIIKLEPQLLYGGGAIVLEIQKDMCGAEGDVRDVVCIRSEGGWEIGLSCKHNHHAVKHSRLSQTLDFGEQWFGVPCSQTYFDEIYPLFLQLRMMIMNAERMGRPEPLWRDIDDKAERFYVPLLVAFMDELGRLVASNPNVPELLIRYMIGRNDFYKVITDDARETTRVEAFNINGTLNKPARGIKSIVSIGRLKMPTRIYHMGFAKESNNTIEIICDEGWGLSMRIHNASSRVEPSLKFDVQLISFPPALHSQVESW